MCFYFLEYSWQKVYSMNMCIFREWLSPVILIISAMSILFNKLLFEILTVLCVYAKYFSGLLPNDI